MSNELDKLYQDDFDTADSKTDAIIEEESENPAELLQVPEDEFKDELDKYDDATMETDNEDEREAVEDRNENDDSTASTS